MLERQSLVERQKVMNEAQNKLHDGQAMLNQREADILTKSQALRKTEKELEDQKENIAAEWKTLLEEKSNLELAALSLSEREKVFASFWPFPLLLGSICLMLNLACANLIETH